MSISTCWVELKVQAPPDLRVQGVPHCPALYSAFSDNTLGRGGEKRGEDREQVGRPGSPLHLAGRARGGATVSPMEQVNYGLRVF